MKLLYAMVGGIGGEIGHHPTTENTDLDPEEMARVITIVQKRPMSDVRLLRVPVRTGLHRP